MQFYIRHALHLTSYIPLIARGTREEKKTAEKYRILGEGREKNLLSSIGFHLWRVCACAYYVLHPGRHEVFIVFR